MVPNDRKPFERLQLFFRFAVLLTTLTTPRTMIRPARAFAFAFAPPPPLPAKSSSSCGRRKVSSSSSSPYTSSLSSSTPSLIIRFAAEQQASSDTFLSLLLSAAPLPPTGNATSHPPILPIDVVDAMPPPLDKKDDVDDEESDKGDEISFYLLRHGQSTSNVEGIISSDRNLAYATTHGMTELGMQQAQSAADPLLDLIQDNENYQQSNLPKDDDNNKKHILLFVSSPFARAYQTAQACYKALDRNRLAAMNVTLMNMENPSFSDSSPNIGIHDNLVERHFGRLDGDELFTYAYVWPLDRFNVTHTAFQVESVAAVCHRLRACITELRDELLHHHQQQRQEGETTTPTTTTSSPHYYHVVLVSHADVLQIAQLYAANVENVGEFSSFRFSNGEVRRMHIGTGDAYLPPPSPLPRPVRGTFIA